VLEWRVLKVVAAGSIELLSSPELAEAVGLVIELLRDPSGGRVELEESSGDTPLRISRRKNRTWSFCTSSFRTKSLSILILDGEINSKIPLNPKFCIPVKIFFFVMRFFCREN